MRLLNFALNDDGISLTWQGQRLDLHNDFDFETLDYAPGQGRVALTWRRSLGAWAQNAALPGFKLVFSIVTFLYIRERDATYPTADNTCLLHASFHPATARHEFDSIWLERLPGDDLTLFFRSEWGLKLNAARAELLPLPETA